MIRLLTFGGGDLREDDGRVVLSILAQPKRFALLVYLAVARPGGMHRRDTLLPLFWPELDDAHARSSLRKALHFLRHSMEQEIIEGRGDDEIGIPEGCIWCDAVAFDRAMERDRLEDALDLYRGELLAGFYLDACPEFDRWVDDARERYRRRAVEAATGCARRAEEEGRGEEALAMARRALEVAPGDERAFRRLLGLQDRLGDRVGALQEYQRFERHARAHGWEPSPETRALLRAIEAREAELVVTSRIRPAPPLEPAPVEPPPTGSAPSRRRRTPPRAAVVVLAGALMALASALVFVRGMGAPLDSPEALFAVGVISEFEEGSETGLLSDALTDMLSTSLGRVPELRVMSNARMHELFAASGASERTASALTRVARHAGVTDLLEGGVHRRPDGELRLDLRRLDLATGSVRGAWTVDGSDLFAVVDEATRLLSGTFGGSPLEGGIAGFTTSSLVAYRFYVQGLREYHDRGDAAAAFRLLSEALVEDPDFALAAFSASEVAGQLQLPERWPLMQQAVAASGRATERERLRITGTWRSWLEDPRAFAVAESLTSLYPDEPDGHLLLGDLLVRRGDFLAAADRFRHVLELDSLGPPRPGAPCRACEAMGAMNDAYRHADSLAAAERVAREAVARAPDVPSSWAFLFLTLEAQGRFRDARSVLRELDRRRPFGERDRSLHLWRLALRAGEFEDAERILLPLLSEDRALEWYRTIALRFQGRLHEALAHAERLHEAPTCAAGDLACGTIPEATVLFEMGRAREAADRYGAILAAGPEAVGGGALVALDPSETRGVHARHEAWYMTLLATALAAADDTARLQSLADSIEAVGPESLFGRDRLLHHHVRGLLALARGDSSAAEHSFRAAIWSPTAGYTRTNLQLGRLLVARGVPGEAVPVLRAALRYGIEGPQLYVTDTEIHALLGRAFEAAGLRDSAAVHYEWVLRAWDGADPEFEGRRTDVRSRLRGLRGR